MRRIRNASVGLLFACWIAVGSPIKATYTNACYMDCGGAGDGCCLYSLYTCGWYCDVCLGLNGQAGETCEVDLGGAGVMQGFDCDCYP
jgi:hypothetical protein